MSLNRWGMIRKTSEFKSWFLSSQLNFIYLVAIELSLYLVRIYLFFPRAYKADLEYVGMGHCSGESRTNFTVNHHP